MLSDMHTSTGRQIIKYYFYMVKVTPHASDTKQKAECVAYMQ